MQYSLLGDSNNPVAHIQLKYGESVRVERGAMVYMKDVDIQGKMNSRGKGIGGFFGAVGRAMTSGESLFVTEARGMSSDASIGIAPSMPGAVHCIHCGDGQQYRLNDGAFLASDMSVNYKMVSQNVGKALFGGTGGLFVMETEGTGDMLINAYGDLIDFNLTDDRLTVDNIHVVAWDRNLDYSLRIASGMFGFTTGEGIVNDFHGTGHVLIQTRNIKGLAEVLGPFFSSGNSN